MSHELSINNGRAEMFSGNNVLPWHKLGTVVSGLLTAKEAIQAAHLDWVVDFAPITVCGKEINQNEYRATVRRDTLETLGIVKARYEVIQNSECFDFMDSLVADGELKYETAGALRGGKQVWMLAKYDGEIEINSDKHEQYLLLVTSHDGSKCLECMWTSVRVVCANTLSIALNGRSNSIKIRHSASWESKRDEAKRVLGLTQDYFANMREVLSGMNEQAMNQDDMSVFSKLLFPAKNEQDVPTRTSNIRWGVDRLFNRGAGNMGASRWDALNAVTDYVDHQSTLRGENSTRLESSLFGTGAAIKQKAFDLLSAEDFTAQLIASRPHVISNTATSMNTGLNDFDRLVGR